MTIKKPLAFYKGIRGKFGAAQFEMVLPHLRCSVCRKLAREDGTPDENCKTNHEPKLVPRYGHVMLEITSATAPSVYDWENKIRFSLGVDDVGKMVQFLRVAKEGEELNLVHDPGKGSVTDGQVVKTLTLTTPKGLKEGCLLRVNQTMKEGSGLSHLVPLSSAEVTVLQIALSSAIPKIIGW